MVLREAELAYVRTTGPRNRGRDARRDGLVEKSARVRRRAGPEPDSANERARRRRTNRGRDSGRPVAVPKGQTKGSKGTDKWTALSRPRIYGKSFRSQRGAVEAVRGVSFELNRGEIFGFLGPNGAGKTTTLRMLTTLLPIDSGLRRCGRLRRGPPPEGSPGADWLREPARWGGQPGHRPGKPDPPGPAVRRRPANGHKTSRETDGDPRPVRVRRPASEDLLGRPAPATGHCIGHRPPARGAVPRRAQHRARPAKPRQFVGPRPCFARTRRHHLRHHSLPRRGRRPVRPAGDHGPRRHRDRRHATRTEAPGSRRIRGSEPSRASTASPNGPRRCWPPNRSSAR